MYLTKNSKILRRFRLSLQVLGTSKTALCLKRVCCAFIFFTVNKVKKTNEFYKHYVILKRSFVSKVVLLKKFIGNTQSSHAEQSADIIYSNIIIKKKKKLFRLMIFFFVSLTEKYGIDFFCY